MFHFTVEADGVHTPRETVLIIVNVLNNTLFRREHFPPSFSLSRNIPLLELFQSSNLLL